MSAYDPDQRTAAIVLVRDYLKTVLDERDGGEGEDLLTRVAGWRRNPRFQSEEEVLSMATLLCDGGLDTVTSELSYIAHHLATHPQLQERLRREPEIAPKATEEFVSRLPNFRLDPHRQPVEHCGSVPGYEQLYLRWD